MISNGTPAPTAPIIMPSNTNGARTKKSVAPMYFIIDISSFLTEIPIVTVLLIKKSDTASKIRMIAADTYVNIALKPVNVEAVTWE